MRWWDGQGNLACCGSWCHKELDMTEPLTERITLEYVSKSRNCQYIWSPLCARPSPTTSSSNAFPAFSFFHFFFNCWLDLYGWKTKTVKLQAATLPRALPPRAALSGCPSRMGFSLLPDLRSWTIRGTSSSSKKGFPASEHDPFLVPTGGSGLEGSGIVLDLPVTCICVMRLVINRGTFCSDQSWYFGLP